MEKIIVQTLKTEENCFGFYYGGAFQKSPPVPTNSKKIYHTKYCESNINESDCIFLDVWLKGETLEDATGNKALAEMKDAISAHKKAITTAKVDITGLCLFDVLPAHLVESYLSQNELLYSKIVKSLDPPLDYEILHKAHVVSSHIKNRPVNLRGSEKRKIIYDIYSSATGRFTTKKGSFPILNIKKEHRQNIVPNNEIFVELDYNGAEVRTLLSLSGSSQPEVDIHDWNNQFCLSGENLSRAEAKKRFFAWLYNPLKKDLNFEKYYDKTIYRDFYLNEKVRTPFCRVLPVDESRALNYLLQSTTADIVTEKAYSILKILGDYKSDLSFTIHDSILLDVDRNEYGIIRKIIEEFENTPLGVFKSNIKIGKDFGNMKELSL